jgi:hypothetical protein
MGIEAILQGGWGAKRLGVKDGIDNIEQLSITYI